jgi:hypothetical protein
MQCSSITGESPDQQAGNGSGVGTGLVSGIIYNPDGKTLARGASVVARFKNSCVSIGMQGTSESSNPQYTTLTDSHGVFNFDTLVDGLYMIEGSDVAGNMVLYDSININAPKKSMVLPDDTLEPAGVITGKIVLANNANFRQVFILAMGVDRFCQVQTDGTFIFPRFASGRYVLKIVSLNSEYEMVVVSSVTVFSNDTTDIGTIELPWHPPLPVPQDINAFYDSSLGQATVQWRPTSDSTTAGYYVYRYLSEINTNLLHWTQMNKDPITDTLFYDSTLFKSAIYQKFDKTVSYAIAMVDKNGQQSDRSPPVKVALTSNWEQFDSVLIPIPRDCSIAAAFLRNNQFNFIVNHYLPRTYGQDPNRYLWVYSFSSDGENTRAWQLPCTSKAYTRITHKDFYSTSYYNLCNPYIPNKSTTDIWLLLNMSPAESKYDSVFVYRLTVTGEFTKEFRIPPEPDSAATDMGAVIMNGNLYYLVGSRSIRKISLESKENTLVHTFSIEYVFASILLAQDDGFVVYAEKPVNYANECTYFTTEGIFLKTVSLPRWYDSPYSTNEPLVAADRSTLYFQHYYFQENENATFTPRPMPDRSFVDPIIMDIEKCILTGESLGVHQLLFYRPVNITRK